VRAVVDNRRHGAGIEGSDIAFCSAHADLQCRIRGFTGNDTSES
jgi:hypothetical protein